MLSSPVFLLAGLALILAVVGIIFTRFPLTEVAVILLAIALLVSGMRA